MRRTAVFGVTPTTTIFLKLRSAAAGSLQDEVSFVLAAHDASGQTEKTVNRSAAFVLPFMNPPCPEIPSSVSRVPGAVPAASRTTLDAARLNRQSIRAARYWPPRSDA